MNKRIFSIVLVASIAMLGCGSSNGSSEPGKTGNAAQTAASVTGDEPGRVIQMTKAMFIEKVFNYEVNPNEWKYLGEKPCIIDFYADWCGPCKRVAPIMDELAQQYKDQIVIYRVNTDQERELAQIFNIRSIPSILYCPSEGKPQMTMGALPKSEFESMIKELLLAKPEVPAEK